MKIQNAKQNAKTDNNSVFGQLAQNCEGGSGSFGAGVNVSNNDSPPSTSPLPVESVVLNEAPFKLGASPKGSSNEVPEPWQ